MIKARYCRGTPNLSGPTPWDLALRRTFDRERHIVHQERLLPGLIE